MIKNIVFDMGNVILRWDPHYIASKLSNDSLEQEVIERELFASKQWQITQFKSIIILNYKKILRTEDHTTELK